MMKGDFSPRSAGTGPGARAFGIPVYDAAACTFWLRRMVERVAKR